MTATWRLLEGYLKIRNISKVKPGLEGYDLSLCKENSYVCVAEFLTSNIQW